MIDIPKPTYKKTFIVDRQSTNDIARLIIRGIRESLPQAEKSKNYFKSPDRKKTLMRLWEFLKFNVKYKAEPITHQSVKSLSRIWEDRKKGNDCKHFTSFVAIYCMKHNIPVMLRMVSFKDSDSTPTHIYPVAIVEGKEIPVDAVINKFGVNPPGVKFKKDIKLNF
jgi:hypothetical protein